MGDRQYRDVKKLIFLAPRSRRIDLFGPVANGRILKRLRVAARTATTVYFTTASLIRRMLRAVARVRNRIISMLARLKATREKSIRHAAV